jgi:uncharacterized Zn-finger protein
MESPIETSTESNHPREAVEVETEIVDCEGDGPSGHPRVYLNLSPRGVAACPYCGRRFVLRNGTPPHGHD